MQVNLSKILVNLPQNTANFAQDASQYTKIHKIYYFASPPENCPTPNTCTTSKPTLEHTQHNGEE